MKTLPRSAHEDICEVPSRAETVAVSRFQGFPVRFWGLLGISGFTLSF
jgi:hypothetical protein